MPHIPQRAIILARMSMGNREENVDTQERNLRAHAKKLGWTVRYVVREEGVSAYQKTRVEPTRWGGTRKRVNRPKFTQVLGMLASGEADGLLARDASRITRDPWDLEDLVDVVESTANPRAVIDTINGDLHLRDKNDISQARMRVQFANDDSERKAEFVRNGKHESVLKGGYHGARPRGCRRFITPQGKVEWVLDEEEARWITTITDMLLEGATLGECCRYLDANEALYPDNPYRSDGTPYHNDFWAHTNLRHMLEAPRIAGLATYRGDVIREGARFEKDDDGNMQFHNGSGPQVRSAKLPAILTEEKWLDLLAVLKGTHHPYARGNSGGNGRNPGFLGTNIFQCGACRKEGRKMFLKGNQRNYCCGLEHSSRPGSHGGKTFRILREPIDDFVTGLIIAELTKPEKSKRLTMPQKKKSNAPLVREAARLQRQIQAAEAEADDPGPDMDAGLLSRAVSGYRRQLDAVTAQLETSAEISPVKGATGPGAAERWKGYSPERQRAIVAYLLDVVINPPSFHPNQHHPFDPRECVGFRWL